MSVQNAASAPQAHTTENAATGPLSTDDLTDVQNRARALQDELTAFYGESQRRSHQTFVLCCFAVGLLAMAAGLYAWVDRGSTVRNLPWHWLPMLGGIGVLGLAVYSMIMGGAGVRAPRIVIVLILVLFMVGLRANGPAPLLFMSALVIFIHLVSPPREALLASLVALAAALLIASSVDPQLRSIFLPRALAASAFALLVMQLLVRRNLAFKDMTRRVSEGLGDMVQSLALDVSRTREARDIAERALAAQREADARLEAIKGAMA
jgi:hypothetical protein